MSTLQGYPALQARLKALQGAQKMKLLAAATAGELRKRSPGQKTRVTANSWQVSSTTATTATVSGNIVNLYLDQGTGVEGPKHQRITPKAAKALRWMGGPAGAFRLSGAVRSGKAGSAAYAIFAKSTKGIRPRPFIQKSLDQINGEVGADVIIEIWNGAA